jgi:hypothetical protein
MNCPRCDAEVGPAARFCGKCGAALPVHEGLEDPRPRQSDEAITPPTTVAAEDLEVGLVGADHTAVLGREADPRSISSPSPPPTEAPRPPTSPSSDGESLGRRSLSKRPGLVFAVSLVVGVLVGTPTGLYVQHRHDVHALSPDSGTSVGVSPRTGSGVSISNLKSVVDRVVECRFGRTHFIGSADVASCEGSAGAINVWVYHLDKPAGRKLYAKDSAAYLRGELSALSRYTVLGPSWLIDTGSETIAKRIQQIAGGQCC